MFNKKKILLGSKSVRRQELLRLMGIKFQSVSINVNENYPKNIQPKEIVNYLSKLKADAFKKNLDYNDILITADTIVSTNKNTILGKPKSPKEAESMLLKLSNSSHKVFTSITLTSRTNQITNVNETEVYFTALSKTDILYYIKTYKPFDKAGAYGIQEWIGLNYVKSIKGSYFNVVGLPTHLLLKMLKQL